MTVNSTSSTATAPMTSLARRDSVGTGTGGRMATVSLLSSYDVGGGASATGRRPRVSGSAGPAGRAPRARSLNCSRRRRVPGVATSRPRLPDSRSGGVLARASAGRRGRPGAQVGEGGERVVQGGDLGHRQTRLGVLHGL